jgi:hypothetical protein
MMTQTTLSSSSSPSSAQKREPRGSSPPVALGPSEPLAAPIDDSNGRATQAWRVVYSIVERNNKKHWLRVGIAFVNRDGSLNVRLDAVPINGQLHIRESRESRETSPPFSLEEQRSFRD